ncbi:MAG: M56 family metallopeptidase, partial [Planctomycetota bacterium]
MDGLPIEDLWRSALAIIPVVLVVAAICRWVPCRPQTRHALWLVVVAVLVASPVVLRLPRPDVRALLDRPAPSVPAVVPSTTPPASPAPARITPTPAPRRSLAAAPAATPPTPASSPRARPAAAAPPRAVARPARASAPSSRPDARRPRPSRPAPPVAPAGPSVVAPGLVKDARQWVGQLDTARVAIMRVPAPPVLVWMGGMLTLLAIIMLRVVRSVRLVAAARPAPPDVAAMVRRGARRMRIRRLPRTVMTDRDVSPMLWCGVRAHLVLPSRLWDRLDEDGREAVVLHELAHLRRRDHWLAWMDLVLGCLYWWHPVVWWVRRRIGDEADLCCDAW